MTPSQEEGGEVDEAEGADGADDQTDEQPIDDRASFDSQVQTAVDASLAQDVDAICNTCCERAGTRVDLSQAVCEDDDDDELHSDPGQTSLRGRPLLQKKKSLLWTVAIPAWCGCCQPRKLGEPLDLFPSKEKHEAATQSFQRLKNASPTLDDVTERQPHWVDRIEDLKMPEFAFGEKSKFSLDKDAQFPSVTVAERSRLDVHFFHLNVKDPVMKSDVKMRFGVGARARIRKECEDLELGTLRIIVRKQKKDRQFKDVKLLVAYLNNTNFFRDMSYTVVHEVANLLELKRYAPGEVLYREYEPVSGILALLRGRVILESGPYTVARGMAAAVGRVIQKAKGQLLGDDDFNNHIKKRPKKDPLRDFDFSDLEESSSLLDEEVMRHSWTAKAHPDDPVEVFYIPTASLLALLEAEETKERLTILRDRFPHTRGKPIRELLEPSKVNRNGRQVSLHNLFTFMDCPRNHNFFKQGELGSFSESMVYLVAKGGVVLKARGAVVDQLSAGAVFGDEVTRGEPYACTAIVFEPNTRLLCIKACDYQQQFMSLKAAYNARKAADNFDPKAWMAKSRADFMAGNGTASHAVAAGSGAAGAAANAGSRGINSGNLAGAGSSREGRSAHNSPRRGGTAPHSADTGGDRADGRTKKVSEALPATTHKAVAIADKLKTPMKLREDVQSLRREEWRSVQPRRAPPRVPPPGEAKAGGSGWDLGDEHSSHAMRRSRSSEAPANDWRPPKESQVEARSWLGVRRELASAEEDRKMPVAFSGASGSEQPSLVPSMPAAPRPATTVRRPFQDRGYHQGGSENPPAPGSRAAAAVAATAAVAAAAAADAVAAMGCDRETVAAAAARAKALATEEATAAISHK